MSCSFVIAAFIGYGRLVIAPSSGVERTFIAFCGRGKRTP